MKWCNYEKLLLLPYSPQLMIKGNIFDPDSSKRNADQLWTLSFGRHLSCIGSEAGHVWRIFVRDMLARMDLRRHLWPPYFLQPTRHHDERQATSVCFLLRKDPSRRASPSGSWQKTEQAMPRYEANGTVEQVHKVLGSICHGSDQLLTRNILFRHDIELRDQVTQMAGCSVAMGIHGAQLMNVMWMEPGSAVVEFHRLSPSKDTLIEMAYYYRNVATLTGHTYFSRQICQGAPGRREKQGTPSHCAGYATRKGVQLQDHAVREVAVAAIASVGHTGGRYDDRPVTECAEPPHVSHDSVAL
eukprot:CAMPEP_0115843980 /NCGR_PEP_ID=MMETSP0287-20121206/8594_1 /TAXON_ID=412157 /ORGANISM="Chrysochromulina rotalis, Strain UIO044" /LENGTH=299 /DNA_ID=CAMNT_0003297695 /DNA_START=339 /DNA_END=1238 /DNA_ORIENTATION=-